MFRSKWETKPFIFFPIVSHSSTPPFGRGFFQSRGPHIPETQHSISFFRNVINLHHNLFLFYFFFQKQKLFENSSSLLSRRELCLLINISIFISFSLYKLQTNICLWRGKKKKKNLLNKLQFAPLSIDMAKNLLWNYLLRKAMNIHIVSIRITWLIRRFC